MKTIEVFHQSKKLGEVAKVISGYAFRSSEFRESGIPVIKIKNIKLGQVDFNDIQFVSKEYLKIESKYYLSQDDILISLTGSHINQPNSIVGRVALFPKGAGNALLNQRAGKILIINDECNNRFLYYQLFEEGTRKEIASFAHGAANQANVSPSQIESIQLFMPALLTQQKIAAILSAYDNLIENNLRRIKILEEIAQFIYREWFIRFRFPGHKNVKMVDSSLGKIPEGWALTPISKITKEINQRNKENKIRRTLSVTNSSSFILSDDYFSKRVYSRKQDKYKIIKEGQFAYNPSRINIGSIAFLEDFDVGIVSPMYCVFEAIPEKVEAPFLWELLKMENTREQIKKLCFGTVRQTFKYPDFSLVRTVLPTIGMQTKFINFMQPFHDMRKCLQQKNALLSRTRDLLLPKLISGELDVSKLDINIHEEVSV
jgi:type I restriction enzyme, S subunit